jgi:polyisoprenoid-binding protein YceI
MVSWVKGVFPDVKGRIDIDENDLSKSTVDVTIDVVSIDTNNAKREKHLRTPDFFDVVNHPHMTFVSKRLVADGGTLRQVVGDLTIRGTTREVVLDVAELTPPVKDPWGKVRRGASASTAINRKDFGLTWNDLMETGGVVVGDEVKIALEVELVKD